MLLLVRKEKVHKAKPQQRIVEILEKEHDDKLVVPIGDKSVDVKPHSGEMTKIAASPTLPICVDQGIQIDDNGVARVSVHMEERLVDRRFVGPVVRRLVGAAMHMHKGKDGCVRQLCGLGIAPILQGCTNKFHIQGQRAPSTVEKKKLLAPTSKLMWRRKEVPHAVTCTTSREGGGGVAGQQDL